MQPQHISNQKGNLVKIKTGTPSVSLGTAASRTQPMLVLRQSGERANYLTHELDMETTCITTTTSTELHTPDNKMIDLGQMVYSIFPSGIMGSAEDVMHQDPLAGTIKAAIFDVQSDTSVDSGGFLPSKNTEGLSLPLCASSLVDSVLPSEKLSTLSMPPCVSSMVDSGLSSEMLPCDAGMMGSVLPSERPLSPSEFLQKNPAPSSQPQMPDLVNEIDQLFADIPDTIPWDSTQELDLNLFSQFGERDVLDNIMQELGIVSEVKEESKFNPEGDTPQFTVPPTLTQSPSIQSDSVGPVRTRRTRRVSRKPARYTQSLDDEPTTTKVTAMAELEDVVASTSSTTPTRRQGNGKKDLSNEEKYLRNRTQNNLASKRCREKRKENLCKMSLELDELERRNKVLQDKVAQLTVLRDNFKEFVNKFLFQQIAQK